MIELKPCPFCGGEAEIQHSAYYDICILDYIWVECKGCDVHTRDCDSEEEAAELWNRRIT